jgi:hypothetical protein
MPTASKSYEEVLQDREERNIYKNLERTLRSVVAPDGHTDDHTKRVFEFIYNDLLNTLFFCPDGNPDYNWNTTYRDKWYNAIEASEKTAHDAVPVSIIGAARDIAWELIDKPEWKDAINAIIDAAFDAITRNPNWARWDADLSNKAVYNSDRPDSSWILMIDTAHLIALKAGQDAALMAAYLMLQDFEFEGKEELHAIAEACWNVWKKGYGLLCDVDGKLYVFAKEQASPGLCEQTATQETDAKARGAL